MKLIEFKEKMMKNNISGCYLFVGEEIGIMNIYLDQLSTRKKLPIIRKDNVVKVLGSINGNAMFGSKSAIYVIRNDFDFQKQEKYFDLLNSKDSIIILIYDKLDSRLKFTKHFKDNIVEFEKLADNILKQYVKKYSGLNDKNALELIRICNGSYDICLQEIAKLQSFCEVSVDINKGFDILVNDSTISQVEKTDVFEFCSFVCNHKVIESFILADLLKKDGVSAINILGTLYGSLKNILLIQACSDKNRITEITGLDNRQIYFARNSLNKYSLEQLVYGIKLISKTVSDIKSGKILDEDAVCYVLVGLF